MTDEEEEWPEDEAISTETVSSKTWFGGDLEEGEILSEEESMDIDETERNKCIEILNKATVKDCKDGKSSDRAKVPVKDCKDGESGKSSGRAMRSVVEKVIRRETADEVLARIRKSDAKAAKQRRYLARKKQRTGKGFCGGAR